MRAVEILRTRDTAPAVVPSHYERLLKCIVNHTVEHRQAIDYCRHMCFGGEMAANAALYQTIVWAYCQRGLVTEAVETAREAKEKLPLDPSTRNAMGLQLLRVCASQGNPDAAAAVMQEFVTPSSSSSSKGSIAELPEVRALMLQAKALAGEWREALALPGLLSDHHGANELRVAALFQDEASPATSTSGRSTSLRPHDLVTARCRLSVGVSAGMDGHWEVGLRCWNALAQPSNGGTASSQLEAMPPRARQKLQHAVLNAMGSAGLWDKALAFLSARLVPDSRHQATANASDVLDATSVALVFAAMQGAPSSQSEADNDARGASSLAPLAAPPAVITEAFDAMSFAVDNLVVLPMVASVSARALIRQGKWEKALMIAQSYIRHEAARRERELQAAERNRGRAVAGQANGHDNAALRAFGIVLSEVASSGGPEARAACDALLPSPPKHTPRVPGSRLRGARSFSAVFSEEQRSVRPSRLQYFPDRRNNFYRDDIRVVPHVVSKTEFVGDPNATPKYAPGSYTDFTSGWAYFPWGFHKTMPENSSKIANPLSLWPKFMPKLANPYRSWSLNESSCHAHRTTVRKWNGRSKV